jgi:hypothetical protein
MRLQRDAILAKYIQEQIRQEAISLKVNLLSNDDAQSKSSIDSKENSNISKPKIKKTTKDKESKSSSSDERRERK